MSVCLADQRFSFATAGKALTLSFDPISDADAYPLLNEAELAEVSQFGDKRKFSENQALFSTGDSPFNSYTILSGQVRIVDTSKAAPTVFVRYGAGRFTGDIDLFTRRPTLVSCEAETGVEAIQLSPAQLREMFTRRPQLGEKFWKSFQRRRELLLQSDFRGVSVYGARDHKPTSDIVEVGTTGSRALSDCAPPCGLPGVGLHIFRAGGMAEAMP